MVIAIIGVLVALLLPAVQSAREASRRMPSPNSAASACTLHCCPASSARSAYEASVNSGAEGVAIGCHEHRPGPGRTQKVFQNDDHDRLLAANHREGGVLGRGDA